MGLARGGCFGSQQLHLHVALIIKGKSNTSRRLETEKDSLETEKDIRQRRYQAEKISGREDVYSYGGELN